MAKSANRRKRTGRTKTRARFVVNTKDIRAALKREVAVARAAQRKAKAQVRKGRKAKPGSKAKTNLKPNRAALQKATDLLDILEGTQRVMETTCCTLENCPVDVLL